MKFRNQFLQGHVLDVLKKFPDECIDCVITSPPYYALRNYDTEPMIWDGSSNCEHEWSQVDQKIKTVMPMQCRIDKENDKITKHGEREMEINVKSGFCNKCGAWNGSLGQEPTYQLYIQHLKQIFAEIKRVLKKTGTVWVNISDTYSQSGGAGNQYEKFSKRKANNFIKYTRHNTKDLPPKCLIGIPERFALMMTDDLGYTRRNTIIWEKPNCVPSSVCDRFTINFEYLYFFVKSRKYYFEQQFEPISDAYKQRSKYPVNVYGGQQSTGARLGKGAKGGNKLKIVPLNPLGRNKRCVWDISTKPYHGAHFAIFPPDLLEIPIKSTCPQYICRKCNKPRETIIEREGKPSTEYMKNKEKSHLLSEQGKLQNIRAPREAFFIPIKTRLSDCGCGAGWKSGIVLDIFMGSGTTALVARKLGRDFVGIELNPDYINMAKKRVDKAQKNLLEVLS